MKYQLLIHELNPDSGRGHELTLNQQHVQDEFPIIPSVGDFISPHPPDGGPVGVFKTISVLIRYGPICMIHITVVRATEAEEMRVVPEA